MIWVLDVGIEGGFEALLGSIELARYLLKYCDLKRKEGCEEASGYIDGNSREKAVEEVVVSEEFVLTSFNLG